MLHKSEEIMRYDYMRHDRGDPLHLTYQKISEKCAFIKCYIYLPRKGSRGPISHSKAFVRLLFRPPYGMRGV